MPTKNKSLTLPLSKLVPMNAALQRISQDMTLPVTTSFRIGRFVAQVQPEFERFEKERMKIIKSYGDQIPMPQEAIDAGAEPKFRIPLAKQDAANQEMENLTAEEVMIPAWKPLKMSDFGTDYKITPGEIAALMPLLDPNFLGDEDEEDESPSKIDIDMSKPAEQPKAVPASEPATA